MKLITPSRITRRFGEKFFFKAYRDASPKAVLIRRPYPPGMHGKRRARMSSEFGLGLREKQKVRFAYGLSNTALKNYAAQAARASGKSKPQALMELLERRLDNALFRLGFVGSRRIARQLINHGHISVNGKTVRTPSYATRPGEVICVKERSRTHLAFEGFEIRAKKYSPPAWLELMPEEWKGLVQKLPLTDELLLNQNIDKVIEFFSR